MRYLAPRGDEHYRRRLLQRAVGRIGSVWIRQLCVSPIIAVTRRGLRFVVTFLWWNLRSCILRRLIGLICLLFISSGCRRINCNNYAFDSAVSEKRVLPEPNDDTRLQSGKETETLKSLLAVA